MANKPASICQAEATRIFKAAKAAGFGRARITKHPDGRLEIVGEDGPPIPEPVQVSGSAFMDWKAKNAGKA